MKLLHRLRSGRVATIDAVKAAPPPSPLAPVDLTDHTQVSTVMDLAARIGDILLSSGTGNNDTKAHIHAVTAAYGLLYCHVDITLNTITISTSIGVTKKTPLSVFRVVRRLTVDFSKLSEVDRLIRSICAGATPPEVAEKILDELMEAPPPYGFRTAWLGWSLFGAAVAVLLGGGFAVAVISFIVAGIIIGGSAWLDRRGLPAFFQNVFGGFVATVPAALSYRWAHTLGFELSPAQIVASGIVVMLAGLTLVQAMQDGITGAPVTASARFFETMMLTGGIVAGVGIGIEASHAIGVTLPELQTSTTPNLTSVTVKVIAGGLASATYAIACYSEWSSVVVSCLTATTGSFVYYAILLPLGVPPVVAVSIAATIIGLAGGLLARRFLIPPLITAIAGITPLLPGLSIYRGLYSILHSQTLVGLSSMVLALAIGSALAAGVVLGEWCARKLRRPPVLSRYRAFAKRMA